MQFLEYKRQRGNASALRLDPALFCYPTDSLRSTIESPVIPPRDKLDDVEFGEFPMARDILIPAFSANNDIR